MSSSRLSILNKNFPYISCHVSPLCEICQYAKQKRLPYKLSTHNAKDPFELVHFDIWGPFNVSSIHGHKYFLTVVDDFSRFTWLYLLKLKSEVPNKIQNFVSFVEVHFKKRIKFIRSDNGPEFNLANFYSSKGIIHQTSCRETPQQNGRVKRKHQHILNVARALLFQCNLPKIFWSYAILHAVFLINRIPTPILNNSSPFEKLYNKAPDYHDLKPFGCLCYFSTLQHNRHKFDARAKKGVFLGYKLGVKGYLYYDLDSGEISVTRNARFSELTFPYPITQTQSTHISIPSLTTISPTHLGPSPINQPIIPFSYDGPPHLPDPTCSLNGPTSPSPPTSPILDADHHVHARPPTTRIRRPPARLRDYHCYSSILAQPNTSSSGNLYPLSHYFSYHHVSPSLQSFALALTTETEPSSYQEACQLECWRKAMEAEILALEENGTWILVDLPPNATPIGSKWVYKIKCHADGSIERYKARLVAKGYTQTEGVDYFDTFSPVAKMTTIRLLLAVASINHWHLHQLDVNNAFLHGDLQETVYMEVPLGVQTSKPNQVCRLLKSLYGLKQASRQWFGKLSHFLLSLGYNQAPSDHTLFVKIVDANITVLLIYVDDIILAGNCLQEFSHLKAQLHSHFRIKDLGQLRYFLGLEVAYS